MTAPRIKFIDPDFRRDPKTDQWCAMCQKDIKGEPRYYIHLVNGMECVHPEDDALFIPGKHGEDYGYEPIGPDCAKRLGKEWTHSRKPD